MIMLIRSSSSNGSTNFTNCIISGTESKNLIKIDTAICKELQTIMSTRAYKGFLFYEGNVNGFFDGKTRKALQNFMGWENYDVRVRDDDQIDREVLDDIRKNYSEWKAVQK